MNYAIFISISVFASLLLMISLHLGISNTKNINISPQKIVAVIKAENRKNSMVARQTLGLPKKNVHIASVPNAKPILPTNAPFPKVDELEGAPLFGNDTFVKFIIQKIKTVFFSGL